MFAKTSERWSCDQNGRQLAVNKRPIKLSLLKILAENKIESPLSFTVDVDSTNKGLTTTSDNEFVTSILQVARQLLSRVSVSCDRLGSNDLTKVLLKIQMFFLGYMSIELTGVQIERGKKHGVLYIEELFSE